MTADALATFLQRGPLYGLNLYEDWLVRRWLKDWHPLYDSIELQVHVGGGVDPGAGFAENMRRMYRHNSQKRMDVLARGPFGATIVEVKHRLDLAQLGQLLGYRWLLTHETNDPTQFIDLVALGFDCMEDVAHVMRAHGVKLITYPRPAYFDIGGEAA